MMEEKRIRYSKAIEKNLARETGDITIEQFMEEWGKITQPAITEQLSKMEPIQEITCDNLC